jgi:protein O-mannosyl-transferase
MPKMNLAAQLRKDRGNLLAIVGSWAFLLLACVLAYMPGLKGPFIFDDFGSIAPLGSLGGVTDWTTFKAFVFGGYAGPTGRPLALLSFLIDANNWPADPWPFKRTNLLIHLANGVLLGVLIRKILHVLEIDKQNAQWVALVSAALWLLHPFLVSTTLYAVQRMAQLSTLFIFLGLIGHLYGRSLIARNTLGAYAVMSLSVAFFTLLAMLSKENGILLPLLIGVMEFTIIASQREQIAALNRYWAWIFLIAPSIIIFLYLGEKVFRQNFFDVIAPRDFSIHERVLTQPRVLFDYLQNWFVPKLYTAGVFQDHFIKSTGLFSPITTVISAFFHVFIITISIINRRKWPLFALAALFFYAGHILESTVINLEMYFEHRNYLAAALLFLPLVDLLQRKGSRRSFVAVAAVALLILTGLTRYSATVWEDYPSMVEAAARKAPTSARAQGQYSLNLFNEGRYDESLEVIDRAIENVPNNGFLLLTRSSILCQLGILSDGDIDLMASIFSAKLFDPRSLELYTTLASLVVNGRCPQVSLDEIRLMLSKMLQVPENADPRSLRYSQLKYLIGFIDVHANRPSQALAAFEESLRARPGAGHAMMMAAVMASKEHHEEALYLSDLALSQLQATMTDALSVGLVRESDIIEFRAIVRADWDAALSAEQAGQ